MPTMNCLRFSEWLDRSKARLEESGIENSRIDSTLLLSHVTGIPHLHLTILTNQLLTKIQQRKLEALLERRLIREPLQYIIGSVDFYGLHLHINRNVLIPRPETEFLVDLIVKENHAVDSILDIGTGSGAIALAIKSEYPRAEVLGVDISLASLRQAIANARRLDLSVKFKKSDVYSNVDGRYDIIVSNPPYLTAQEYNETSPEVHDFEPKIALEAEDNGLAVYSRILAKAKEHLNTNGRIYLEIGHQQADSISFLAQKCGFTSMEKKKDFNGYDRYLIIRT